MAGLSAIADHGSGHLLGLVLGDGQALSMADYHVRTLSVYAEESSSFFFFSHSPSLLSHALCFHHRVQAGRIAVSLSGTI